MNIILDLYKGHSVSNFKIMQTVLPYTSFLSYSRICIYYICSFGKEFVTLKVDVFGGIFH